MPSTPQLDQLLALGHELGHEDRRMAILAEGNISTRVGPDRFLIKASGKNLATLTESDVVACRSEALLPFLDAPDTSDDEIEAALMASRLDSAAPKPSVEALFHAHLLNLDGVEWVAHTHPISVNSILCSPRARDFARRRLFPDEIVCCGEQSLFIPYFDPGLKLAIEIRRRLRAFPDRKLPRVILLANHGLITIGPSAASVRAAMLMTQKAADIWLGAAPLGGPTFLTDSQVRRIAGRADEHHRQRALGL